MEFAIILIQYAVLLFSLCVHEAAHAGIANRCGDPSARLMGRLTLNPLRHIDPIGTVVLPLLMLYGAGGMLFGWAKPVPFNPRNLHNLRRDPVFIALAGPGANLLLVIGGALMARIFAVMTGFMPDLVVLRLLIAVFIYFASINAMLMLFNLLPVPPLDGHHVLGYFLPPGGQRVLEQIGPMGIIIVIILVNTAGILDGPSKLLHDGIRFLAFYGTPLFEIPIAVD